MDCEHFLGTLPGGPAALSEAATWADVFNEAAADGRKQADDSAPELRSLVAQLCSGLQAACPELTDGKLIGLSPVAHSPPFPVVIARQLNATCFVQHTCSAVLR